MGQRGSSLRQVLSRAEEAERVHIGEIPGRDACAIERNQWRFAIRPTIYWSDDPLIGRAHGDMALRTTSFEARSSALVAVGNQHAWIRANRCQRVAGVRSAKVTTRVLANL